MNGAPVDLSTWKDEAANQMIFRLKGGDHGEAVRLLEIGRTNRIVTPDEARLLILLRLEAYAMGMQEYRWLIQFCDDIEAYQLTIGVPVNSRKSFAEVLTAELRAAREKAAGLFGSMFGKGGESGGA